MSAGLSRTDMAYMRQHRVTAAVAREARIAREKAEQPDYVDGDTDGVLDGGCATCCGTGLGLTEETRCWACKGLGQRFLAQHYEDND